MQAQSKNGIWSRVHIATTQGFILGALHCPMGIWSRAYSATSRGTSDVQQWLFNAEARRS